MPDQPSCVLRSLVDPHLSGALPGLTITHDQLQMTPANFQCCEGTGVQIDTDGRDSHRCDLRSRTARVAALVRQFRETWGQETPLPLAITQADLADLARRLQGGKGRSLARKAPMVGPSPMWAIAFAAAWRFGWNVHVATIHKTPWEKLTYKNAGYPLLVMVEGIDSLWDVRRADELEFVVGWAYHARAQLWCDWLLHVPPEQGEGRRKQASHRIAMQRARSPLAWLNADMHSKLSFLTDGLDPIIRWPASRAKGKPSQAVDHPPKNL